VEDAGPTYSTDDFHFDPHTQYSRIQKAQATVTKQKLIEILKTASVLQLQPTQLQSEVLTGMVAGMAGQRRKVPLQCQAQYLQAAVLFRTRAGAGAGAEAEAEAAAEAEAEAEAEAGAGPAPAPAPAPASASGNLL